MFGWCTQSLSLVPANRTTNISMISDTHVVNTLSFLFL